MWNRIKEAIDWARPLNGDAFLAVGGGSVIDTAKLDVVGTIPTGEGTKPMGMALTKDGSKLYVSTGRGKSVLVIDTGAGKVVGNFEVGQRPWGIALSPDEKLLFTANGPSNDVSIVDLATKSILKKVKVGDRPWGVAVVAQ